MEILQEFDTSMENDISKEGFLCKKLIKIKKERIR